MIDTLLRSSSDSHAIGRALLADGAFCAVNRGARRVATASDRIAADLRTSQAFYRSPLSGAKSHMPGDNAWFPADVNYKEVPIARVTYAPGSRLWLARLYGRAHRRARPGRHRHRFRRLAMYTRAPICFPCRAPAR
jgi:hypothetical protein